MIHAYDKIYLDSAQANLGTMLDVAVNEWGLELKTFYEHFLKSICSLRFAKGDPGTIAGRSGIELGQDVLTETLERCDLTDGEAEAADLRKLLDRPIDPPINRSPEYWTGWAVAYYQWDTGITFQRLDMEIPIERIRDLYHPYHETDIRQLVDEVNRIRRDRRLSSYLKLYRKQAGMTQQELAQAAEVPVRTIQQYEQRQKNINNARSEYVISMAAALGCEPADLLEI